jgi:hypothetical protein
MFLIPAKDVTLLFDTSDSFDNWLELVTLSSMLLSSRPFSLGLLLIEELDLEDGCFTIILIRFIIHMATYVQWLMVAAFKYVLQKLRSSQINRFTICVTVNNTCEEALATLKKKSVKTPHPWLQCCNINLAASLGISTCMVNLCVKAW